MTKCRYLSYHTSPAVAIFYTKISESFDFPFFDFLPYLPVDTTYDLCPNSAYE